MVFTLHEASIWLDEAVRQGGVMPGGWSVQGRVGLVCKGVNNARMTSNNTRHDASISCRYWIYIADNVAEKQP
jgi:hypothetical protein